MLSDNATLTYAIALLLTLVVEIPVVTVALARWYRVAVWRGATIAIVASVLTHPVVWFVLPPLLVPTVGSAGYLLVAEGLAWLVEAGIFWLTIRRDPVGLLLVSLLANLASFTIGGLLHVFGAL